MMNPFTEHHNYLIDRFHYREMLKDELTAFTVKLGSDRALYKAFYIHQGLSEILGNAKMILMR